MRYDLHLHTCLSPCADRDMTPATVAGLAKLAGAELIAITDHNSALNLPAAEKACREYGLRLLPGPAPSAGAGGHHRRGAASALLFQNGGGGAGIRA